MTEFRQGLVIGKFYPLHLGHLSLIERAAARCEQAAVIVMASQRETMTLAQRVSWTREATARLGNVSVIGILDDAPVDYRSQIAWVAHHEVMLAGLRNAGIGRIDAVFSSEAYGQELADRFAAVCVLDDLERQRVPMSATMARTDPSAHWQMVSEPARRDLARRFVVVGAESTGTTTLTDELFEHYRVRYPSLQRVDEYGREFTYALFAESQAAALASGVPAPSADELVWTTSHFAHIAATQTARGNTVALAST